MTGPTKQVRVIALITPYKSGFDEWVRDFGREDEQYVWVSKEYDCDGRYFAAIQRGLLSFRVDQNVVELAKSRVL